MIRVENNGTTCIFYDNVSEQSMISNKIEPTTPQASTQYFKKDYPTIGKSEATTRDYLYLNKGTYFSGLDFLSNNLCAYGYNTSEPQDISTYLDNNPFNFYNKSVPTPSQLIVPLRNYITLVVMIHLMLRYVF